MSSPTSTNSEKRIILINSEKFGLSPVERSFDINWIGNLSYANLVVDFSTSIGYGLDKVYVNGTEFDASVNPAHFEHDVRFLLLQGSNKVTVVFNALQLLGVALGAAQITAYVDYFGATVIKFPSLTQGLRTLATDIQKNTGTAIVIIAGVAIALGSIAYVMSRLPSGANIKLPNLSKVADQTQSKLKHVIMSIGAKN
jgi:hypothetical protein